VNRIIEAVKRNGHHEAANQEGVLIMEKLEKVELVREKCNVSFEEARRALEACDYDVLDAIVMLEQAQAAAEAKRRVAAEVPPAPEAAYELPGAAETEADPEPTERKTARFARAWKRFCSQCETLLGAGMKTSFVAERNGEVVFEVPVLLVIVGLLMWGASLWLLIVGLFLGFRYRIEGTGKVTDGVNEAMDKAADAAADIKQSVA